MIYIPPELSSGVIGFWQQEGIPSRYLTAIYANLNPYQSILIFPDSSISLFSHPYKQKQIWFPP